VRTDPQGLASAQARTDPLEVGVSRRQKTAWNSRSRAEVRTIYCTTSLG